ncbi:MAG TPA: DR2241 family protein [Candidatus Udaeobacter sp.]|nr:DR2241 family protein [Candidatus Udaeobacter sp.]
MPDFTQKLLKRLINTPFYFGQILVEKSDEGFLLRHRDDEGPKQLQTFRNAEDAIEIAKYDDAGNYRPLKTAPNLRRGWRLVLDNTEELSHALDYFYPGRLAMFAAWKSGRLQITPLRATLDRQSGMYRVAAKISDSQINDVVADFCRSDVGCLRTILWKRDADRAIASAKLPNEKFDPARDQTSVCSRRALGDARSSHPPSRGSGAVGSEAATVPLLCQEACNLLVAECRKVVKAENARDL